MRERIAPIENDELERLADMLARKLEASPVLADMVAARLRTAQPALNALPGKVPGLEMEPFFQDSDVSKSILELLPMSHRRKWMWFFADWGCLRCSRGENEGFVLAGNGLCSECRPLITNWLAASIKKRVADDAIITAEEAIARHRRRPLTEGDLEKFTPETIMEPWFLPKQIETAIGQLTPISKRRKWVYFFLDHGCLRCGRADVKHSCLGMCRRCYMWVHYHLGASIKRHTDGAPAPEDLAARLTYRATTVQRIFAGEEVLPMPPADPEPEVDPLAVWKRRLGRGCARIIDAMSNRGELSTAEIATITGLTVRTVQDNLAVLRRNTLIESDRNSRVHVLRNPCEHCRQVRQTLFRNPPPPPELDPIDEKIRKAKQVFGEDRT